MSDLPKSSSWVIVNHTFTHAGIAYADPIFAKEVSGRGKLIVKAYICLFICFVTKACHIELVGDLISKIIY